MTLPNSVGPCYLLWTVITLAYCCICVQSSEWDCSSEQHSPVQWKTLPAPPYVYFVHLRKTGGSTLEYMLLREANFTVYMEQRRRRGRENLEVGAYHMYRWFQSNQIGKIGHYDFSEKHHLNRQDKSRKPVYITMLRHPVQRIMSAYWFAHRFWRYKDEMVWPNGTSKMSLSEFVETGKGINNHQYLALKQESDVTVQEAIETLRTQYGFVGVLERFDDSMMLLERRLGINAHYQVRNKAASTGYHRAPTPQETELILKYNNKDLLLWKAASEMVQAQVECFGRNWEVERFKWQTEQRKKTWPIFDDGLGQGAAA